MAELPDVELYKRHLDTHGIGKRVNALHVRDRRLLKGAAPSTLRRHVKSRVLASSRRHGKLLFAAIEGNGSSLLMHFGMTGWLEGYGASGSAPDQSAVVLDFADGSHLAYCDPRTFGRFDLVDDVDAYLSEKSLGPDPLDESFDLTRFREALDAAAIRSVHRAICYVLPKAIEARADPEAMPKSFILPDRRAGTPCPSCDGKLQKLRIAGRQAYFWASCQRRY